MHFLLLAVNVKAEFKIDLLLINNISYWIIPILH